MLQGREEIVKKGRLEAIFKVSVKIATLVSTNTAGRILAVLRHNRSRSRRTSPARVHHLEGSDSAKRSRKRLLQMSMIDT